MSLQIERVVDDAAAREYHAIESETIPVDHPGLVAEPLDDLLGVIPNPMPSYHLEFYVGRAEGVAVATGFMGLPLVENTHLCNMHVVVALDRRRLGHGSQMASYLCEQGRRAERRLATSFVGAPLEGTSPGNEFASSLGATPALGSIRRELRLAELDRAALDARLKELREGPCAAYELVSWADACPDHLVEGAALILPRVMSDSPQGELDVEDEVWDAARFREYESMFAFRRRHELVTAAVERTTGRLVAFTDLNVPMTEHRMVSQYGTVVEPDHRGHRLGLAVKTANLVNLLDAFPDAVTVQTFNASENEHMIAVNEALGYRIAERSTIWQLQI